MDILKKFDDIENLIGNTPLLEISYEYKGKQGKIFAKAEYYNLTGSIKDRVAFYILKKAYEKGTIKDGDVISEATSGNTGIAFSAIGSYLGHDVVIYMPDWMTKERISMMESFGAKVELVSRDEGGFLGSIAKTEKLAAKGGVFLPGQFTNEENCEAHYLTTGKEIAAALEKINLQADGIVAGVGTGGTVMGIGRRLKTANPNCKIFPLEPLNSPTLSTGYKVGNHRIYGISDEFIPDIFKREETDDIISVDDGDSIVMSRLISQELGIGVGVSSGANFLGAVLAHEKLGENSVVVTVFADDNKKYLSTDYAKDVQFKENYISKEIKLLGVKAYR